jgi:hypothetical protein
MWALSIGRMRWSQLERDPQSRRRGGRRLMRISEARLHLIEQLAECVAGQPVRARQRCAIARTRFTAVPASITMRCPSFARQQRCEFRLDATAGSATQALQHGVQSDAARLVQSTTDAGCDAHDGANDPMNGRATESIVRRNGERLKRAAERGPIERRRDLHRSAVAPELGAGSCTKHELRHIVWLGVFSRLIDQQQARSNFVSNAEQQLPATDVRAMSCRNPCLLAVLRVPERS